MKWSDYWESNFPRRFKCRECGEYFLVPIHYEPERDRRGRVLCDDCYEEYILEEGEKKFLYIREEKK